MKKLVVLMSTLVLSAGIHAAEDRNIYDLMYLPKAGTGYGFTTLGFGQLKRESDQLGDVDFEGFQVDQTLGYALSDRFSLQLSMDYAKIEADPEGGSKYDSVKGISDPTLTARFRAVDEAFRLDLVGGALINFQDREVKRDGETNNTQGGHSFLVGPEVGVKSENVQWFAGAYLIHHLKAETEYKTILGNAKIEDDSHNELLVRTALLHRLHEKNMLKWSAEGNFTRRVGNDRENLIGKTAPQTNYDFGLEYQYVASDDVLIRLGGSYQIYNTNTGQIDEFQGWNAYLGANYQF